MADDAAQVHGARACRVVIDRMPEGDREAGAVAMVVARALRLPLGDARRVLEALPATLPRQLEPAEAADLVAKLEQAGAAAASTEVPAAGRIACAGHPALDAFDTCTKCGAATCSLCFAPSGGRGLCARCGGKSRRSKAFFRVRVAVLLSVLAAVLLYAWHDVRQRRARTDWSRTLNVTLVVLRLGPVSDDPIAALRARAPALKDRLTTEFRRYHGAGPEPFALSVRGPVDVTEGPPVLAGDGVADLARHAYATFRYLRRVDAAAALDTAGVDSRVYVVVRPARDRRRTFVEGSSEQGGRVGFVEVELEASMVDFALFVAAHELLHTLGATDKYDAAGDVLVPSGLAEPDLSPLLPQRYVELMARHRPIAPGVTEPPSGLHELRVGPATAKEIGWTR